MKHPIIILALSERGTMRLPFPRMGNHLLQDIMDSFLQVHKKGNRGMSHEHFTSNPLCFLLLFVLFCFVFFLSLVFCPLRGVDFALGSSVLTNYLDMILAC